MTIRAKAAWLATAILLAMPTSASACPLCIAAQDESVQIAYIFATGFMTFLPFALVGGLIFWLRRRARQLALEEAAGVIRLPSPGARPNRAA